MMPERFDHLVIMNTWLHHSGYEYSDGIKGWNAGWHEGGLYHKKEPDIGLLPLVSAGLLEREEFIRGFSRNESLELSESAALMYAGYSAPYRGLPDEGYNGFRRFPLSIPFDNANNGNAAAQALHYRTLLGWENGCQFIWGCQDNVFTEEWGRAWAGRMNNARFDGLPAGHFPQNTHGRQLVELILDERGNA